MHLKNTMESLPEISEKNKGTIPLSDSTIRQWNLSPCLLQKALHEMSLS